MKVRDEGRDYGNSRMQKKLRDLVDKGDVEHTQQQSTVRGLSKKTPLPAKKARLTRTGPTVEDKNKDATQSKPPIKRPYAFPPENPENQGLSSAGSKRFRPEDVSEFVMDWLAEVYPFDNKFAIQRHTIKALSKFTRDAFNSQAGSQVSLNSLLSGPSGSNASVGSPGGNLVEIPTYRVENLATNNICLRPRENFPKHIENLLSRVFKDLDSPAPSSDQIENDTALYALENGAPEAAVKSYFIGKRIFPHLFHLPNGLKVDESVPMLREVIPDVGSTLKVSTPIPDMLYGYQREAAFSRQQQKQILDMKTEMLANKDDMIYPFFVVEFKGDGPTGSGSLWTATNQCLGGVASCINITELLNRRLQESKLPANDSAAFSIAMNGTEARLFIAWRNHDADDDDDDDEQRLPKYYYMQKIRTFALQESGDHVQFRKYVRNIIDWGKGQRLDEIRRSLDSLWDISHPPEDEPAVGSRPKRKAAKRASVKTKGKTGTKTKAKAKA